MNTFLARVGVIYINSGSWRLNFTIHKGVSLVTQIWSFIQGTSWCLSWVLRVSTATLRATRVSVDWCRCGKGLIAIRAYIWVVRLLGFKAARSFLGIQEFLVQVIQIIMHIVHLSLNMSFYAVTKGTLSVMMALKQHIPSKLIGPVSSCGSRCSSISVLGRKQLNLLAFILQVADLVLIFNILLKRLHCRWFILLSFRGAFVALLLMLLCIIWWLLLKQWVLFDGFLTNGWGRLLLWLILLFGLLFGIVLLSVNLLNWVVLLIECKIKFCSGRVFHFTSSAR